MEPYTITQVAHHNQMHWEQLLAGGSESWTLILRSGRRWCGAISCVPWNQEFMRKQRIRPRWDVAIWCDLFGIGGFFGMLKGEIWDDSMMIHDIFFLQFPGKGLWIAQFLRERGRVMETWWNLFSSHASGWDTHRTRGGGNHRFTRLHRWWKSWRMRMMTTTSPTQPKWIWSSSRSLSVISDYFGFMLFLVF